MPDRYGENPDHDLDAAAYARRPDVVAARRDSAAIDACGLCDDNGTRNGFACDHIDHAEASKRGMDMIRETMGWNT